MQPRRTIVTLAINAALRVIGTMPTCELGNAYSATVTAFGGSGSGYIFTPDPGQSLPSGLTGTDNNDGTYTVAGTTSVPGPVHVFGILSDNERNSVPYSFNFLVQPLPLTISGHIAGGLGGAAASGSYSSSGGVGTKTFTVIAGTFPTTGGLSSAGAALGNWSAPGSYSWTVRVTDSATPTPNTVDLADSCTNTYATLTLTGTYFGVAAAWETNYSQDLAIAGGSGTYSNPRVTSGSLPSGMSLSIVSGNLRLAGQPTSFGSFSFTAAVDSSDGQTATSAQTLYALDMFGSGERGGVWNFYDKSHMWQNSNGTGAVVNHGDPIGRIDDLSGNGNHWIQATSGNRPTWDLDSTTGLEGVKFVASSSQFMYQPSTSNPLYPGVENITFACGFRASSIADFRLLYSRSYNGAFTGRYWYGWGSTNFDSYYVPDGSSGQHNSFAFSNTSSVEVLLSTTDRAGITITNNLNGSNVGSQSGSGSPDGTETNNMAALLGAYPDSSSTATGTSGGTYMDGFMLGAMALRITALDSTKNAKLKTLIGSKVGLSL